MLYINDAPAKINDQVLLSYYHGRTSDGWYNHPVLARRVQGTITAAKITSNLTRREQCDLIMDAVYRAEEFGQMIELDDFMKVVYGYSADEKRVIGIIAPIHYVSKAIQTGTEEKGERDSGVPQVRDESGNHDDFER